MGYTNEQWRHRIAERSDIATTVTHLTRESTTSDQDVMDILFKILRDRILTGSSTASGFICGDKTAVCFQDAPPQCLAQNIWYEQKYRKDNKNAKVRYMPFGLTFTKQYVYNKGGRPVIYDATAEAKAYLDKDQWWRIVNLNHADSENIVDWMHEREWRTPGNFPFALGEATVLLSGKGAYQEFVRRCRTITDVDLLAELGGLISLAPLLF